MANLLRVLAGGHSVDEILRAYPYIERDDIGETLGYAAWLAESPEETLATG